MSPLLPPTLEAGRDRYNARFNAARLACARLDPEAFLDHLARHVSPLLDAAHPHDPDRDRHVLDAAYDASLQLFAASQLGPDSSQPAVLDVWARLLPACGPHLAQDPARVIAALSNAAVNLARARHARPTDFVDALLRAAPHCPTARDVLTAGQVAGWTAGLPHYRTSALAALRTLPSPAANALFQTDALDQDRLSADSWFDPKTGTSAPAHVGTVGDFRGFAGEFLAPPTVYPAQGRTYATDGTAHYLLFADRFGRLLVLQPAPPAGYTPVTPPRRDRPALAPDGRLMYADDALTFPHLAHARSQSFDGHTLALTLPDSYQIHLISIPAPLPAGAGT